MKVKKSKYDAFSKVFAQLSEKSQDQLMKIAYRLLETHRFAKQKTSGKTELQLRINCSLEN